MNEISLPVSLISRRQFSKMGLVGMTGSIMNHLSASEEKSGWIDAHVHVWTDDTQRYPLDQRFSIADMKPRSFTPEELFSHTDANGVTRVVLIQMSFYGYDNSYMLDAMERYPKRFSGVGIVDYHSTDLRNEMKKLTERGVRGLRITTKVAKTDTWLSDSGMEQLWKTAADLKLAVCPLINPTDIPYVDQLCNRFQDTIVVVDHFARIGMGGVKPDQLEALCRLARFPNVFVKTSAFYAVGGLPPYDDAMPMLKRVIDAFGVKRLMWASDCPFQVQSPHEYTPALAVIRDRLVGLSDDERAWLLRGTAEQVFFS